MKVNVGDYLREAPEPKAASEEPEVRSELKFEALCNNCFHQFICSISTAIRTVGGIAVGRCQYHLPVAEKGPGTEK